MIVSIVNIFYVLNLLLYIYFIILIYFLGDISIFLAILNSSLNKGLLLFCFFELIVNLTFAVVYARLSVSIKTFGLFLIQETVNPLL